VTREIEVSKLYPEDRRAPTRKAELRIKFRIEFECEVHNVSALPKALDILQAAGDAEVTQIESVKR